VLSSSSAAAASSTTPNLSAGSLLSLPGADVTGADVVIKLRDLSSVRAHSAILSVRSPLFASLLNRSRTIDMSQWSGISVRALLRYVYGARIDFASHISGWMGAIELLQLASMYGIESLADAAIPLVMQRLSPDRIFATLAIADTLEKKSGTDTSNDKRSDTKIDSKTKATAQSASSSKTSLSSRLVEAVRQAITQMKTDDVLKLLMTANRTVRTNTNPVAAATASSTTQSRTSQSTRDAVLPLDAVDDSSEIGLLFA